MNAFYTRSAATVWPEPGAQGVGVNLRGGGGDVSKAKKLENVRRPHSFDFRFSSNQVNKATVFCWRMYLTGVASDFPTADVRHHNDVGRWKHDHLTLSLNVSPKFFFFFYLSKKQSGRCH